MTKEIKGRELLSRRLRKVCVTVDDVNLVANVITASELEPCSGEKADFVTRTLTVKYYHFFKGKYSQLELANIIYAILTDKLCDVCYFISACYEAALSKYRSNIMQYPLEFFLSTAIEGLNLMPKSWKIFDEDCDEECVTVLDALQGIHRADLHFPSETNRVIAYPDADYYLLYVEDEHRWLAVIHSHIAAVVQQYSNPVYMTPEGLVLGETLLRFLPPFKGVVVDDYILI